MHQSMQGNLSFIGLREFFFRRWTLARLFLALTLFMNGQIFAASAWNPMGIKGIQEVFLAILAAFSIVVILTRSAKTKGILRFIDVAFFLLILIMWIYPAVAANLHFGQPLYYGLIEERRVLANLVYFPIVWGLRNSRIFISDIFAVVTITAILGCILSTLVRENLIAPLHQIETHSLALRQERYSVAQHYVVLALIISVYLIGLRRNRFVNISLVAIYVFTIVLVFQTRQLMAGAFLACLVISMRPSITVIFRVAGLAAACVGLYFLILYAAPDLYAQYATLFASTVDSDQLEESSRGLAYAAVMHALRGGNYFGYGTLSLLWQGGFERVYGEFFVPADIGLMGTVYKCGIAGIILYLLYVWLQGRFLLPLRSNMRSLVFGFVTFLAVLFPVAAPIEFRGFIVGLTLAISVVLVERQKSMMLIDVRGE